MNSALPGTGSETEAGDMVRLSMRLDGYRVTVTENQLQGAPRFTSSTGWDWNNRDNDRRVYDYYKTPLWY